MRVGIRTKQVVGVTAVVGASALVLLGWYAATLAQVMLDSSRTQAHNLAQAAYLQTFEVVARGGDPVQSIRDDEGLKTIFKTAAFGQGIVYAAIVDASGLILADDGFLGIGTKLDPAENLDDLVDNRSPWTQLRAIYRAGGQTFQVSESLDVAGARVGTIHVGVSTLLIRSELSKHLRTPIITAIVVFGVSVLLAMLLAQLVLKPIHVIRGGLAKLGRGELDVNVDLPPDAELRGLGASFSQITARLAESRTEAAGQSALRSAMDHLEEAVAMFSQDGLLLFSNPSMHKSFGKELGTNAPEVRLADLWPADHPYRLAVEDAIAGKTVTDPPFVEVPNAGQRLLLTHVVPGAGGVPLGVLLVSRNVGYLTQVETTVRYSQKLAAISQLTAGIAHEIKNPLNATMIHLELLRMEVQDRPQAVEHVGTIAAQVRRLDDVVQGFMKFTRPEQLHLEAVELKDVFDRLRPLLEVEAGSKQVQLAISVPAELPAIEGDANLLEQAFLNLALNAYQAMPDGGRIDIEAREAPGKMVAVEVRDTGSGIAPENLSRIFDLYFTTKPTGSGIGLSLVFRTIQMHDGEVDVESTPGRGTTFRVSLRQAPRMFQGLGA